MVTYTETEGLEYRKKNQMSQIQKLEGQNTETEGPKYRNNMFRSWDSHKNETGSTLPY